MAKRKKTASAKQAGDLHRTCGTMAVHMMLLERFPEYRMNMLRLEEATDRRRAKVADITKAKRVTIRAVVNVVYREDIENISMSQIKSQISTLNRDFAATNSDKSLTPAPWKGLITDSHLRFKLVKVTRTKTAKSAFSHDDSMKSVAGGGIPPYKPKTHLNIWVCALSGGLLGYAQFPGGPLATDGVVANFRAFGTNGTAQAPFNKGRTATHEIGHYLNLRHVWGDTPDCSGSDMVADTPNCAGPNSGMPTWPVITCNNGPNGDMFVNYMDYTDDAGMVMFTSQQVLRMRTALDTMRSGLL